MTLNNITRSITHKFVLLLLNIFLIGGHTYATVSSYCYVLGSTTYTPISGGTLWATGTGITDNSYALPVPFAFTYNSTTYSNALNDSIAISSNGFLKIGHWSSINITDYTPISGTADSNTISAIGANLAGTSTSEIRYQVNGTSPNEVLVVQWKNMTRVGGTDTLNFQISLSQTSNIIAITYGACSCSAASSTVQVGLRGAANSDYYNRTTTTNWSATVNGGANTSTCTLSGTVVPASGTTFSYCPSTIPAPTVTPNIYRCDSSRREALTASGAIQGLEDYKWYNVASGGTPLQTSGSIFFTPILTTSTTYYVSIYNVQCAVYESSRTPVTIFVYPAQPAIPLAIAATGLGCNGFTANWDTVAQDYGYYIDVATDTGFTNIVPGYNNRAVIGTTSVFVSGLTVSTNYYYRVRAYNTCGTSANSARISTHTTFLASPPVITGGSSITCISFTAGWDTSALATSYYLDVAFDSAFALFLTGYNDLYVGNVVSYAVSGLTTGTKYYYRVRAENSCGQSSNSTMGSVTTGSGGSCYCTVTGTMATNNGIANVTYNSINNTTGKTAGYNNYFNQDTTTVFQDSIYTLSASVSSNGAVVYARAWIDWNHDGVFASDTTEQYDLGAAPANGVTSLSPLAIKVPHTAALGKTVLRVEAQAGNYPVLCGTGIDGEVEDYGLTVTTKYPTPASVVSPKNGATGMCRTGTVLSWSPPTLGTAPTAYKLYFGTNNPPSNMINGIVLTNLLSYTAPTLNNNTTYYWKIVPTDSAGDASGCPVWYFTTGQTPAISSTTPGSVCFSGTVILSAVPSSGTVSWFSSSTGGTLLYNGNTYVTPSISASTTYYIQAADSMCTSSPRTAITAAVLNIPTATLSTPSVSCNVFWANWLSNPLASNFQLDVATDTFFTTFVAGYNNLSVGNASTYKQVTGLNENTKYYYRLRAQNVCGVSANSAVQTLKTDTTPGIPLNPAIAWSGCTSVGIDWSYSLGSAVLEYTIQFATDPGFNNIVPAYNNYSVGNTNSYTVSNLAVGTTYFYQVRAQNNCGVSGNSNVVEVSTTGGTGCYCTAFGSPSTTTGITNVDFNTINQTSGTTTGYSNYYNTDSTVVYVDSSYSLQVTLNTNGPDTIYARAWIDWNKDGLFTAFNEQYDLGFTYNSSSGLTSLSPLVIAVPASATLGDMVMRVAAKAGAYPALCETGFNGEVEDYKLIVNTNTVRATVTPADTTICAGSNATFTASGGAYYLWNNGATTASINVSQAGTYSVTVTNINHYYATASCILNVSPIVTPSVSLGITSGANPSCANKQVTFTASSLYGGTQPVYSFKLNGTLVQNGNSASYTNSTLNNNDVISCILTSNAGCLTTTTATSDSIRMTINQTPVVTVTPPSPSICSGNQTGITLSSNVGSPVYTWAVIQGQGISGGNSCSTGCESNINQTLSNSSGSSLSSATYNITVTSGNCTASASSVVTVNPNPVITVTPPGATICSGNAPSLALTSTVTVASYSWSVVQGLGISGANAGSGSIIAQPLTNAYGTAGTATYTITGTTNGCTGSATATVTINSTSTPTVAIAANDTVICPNNNVSFTSVITNSFALASM